jgi:hypothetical protein
MAAVGDPHVDENAAGSVQPPKPVFGEKPAATAVVDPTHVARVTSVHEEEPAVQPVPAGHGMQALESIAPAPPSEYWLFGHATTPAPMPAAPAPQ